MLARRICVAFAAQTFAVTFKADKNKPKGRDAAGETQSDAKLQEQYDQLIATLSANGVLDEVVRSGVAVIREQCDENNDEEVQKFYNDLALKVLGHIKMGPKAGGDWLFAVIFELKLRMISNQVGQVTLLQKVANRTEDPCDDIWMVSINKAVGNIGAIGTYEKICRKLFEENPKGAIAKVTSDLNKFYTGPKKGDLEIHYTSEQIALVEDFSKEQCLRFYNQEKMMEWMVAVRLDPIVPENGIVDIKRLRSEKNTGMDKALEKLQESLQKASEVACSGLKEKLTPDELAKFERTTKAIAKIHDDLEKGEDLMVKKMSEVFGPDMCPEQAGCADMTLEDFVKGFAVATQEQVEALIDASRTPAPPAPAIEQ